MNVLLAWLLLMGIAEAKTITVPKAGKNENQLHEELLAAFPAWKAVNGVDPGLLRVESTNTEIRLTVPDETEEAAVTTILSAHVPKPPVKPEEEQDIPVGVLGGTLGGALAALGINSLRGKKKEPA